MHRLTVCALLALAACPGPSSTTATVTGVCPPNSDQRDVGAACSSKCDCKSGACVDGLCCENACEGACVSCNQKGLEGLCRPIAAGSAPQIGHLTCAVDPAKPCELDGLCDGNGACRKALAGNICKPAACANDEITPASTCNGGGQCVDASPQPCAPYKCEDATSCATSCSAPADCTGGSTCTASSCGASPLGAFCTDGATCVSGMCTDGACCTVASCGPCKNCGATGACSVTVTNGQDVSGTTCDGTQSCDGGGACKSANGQMCAGDGECASGHCTHGRCCDTAAAACTGCKRCDNAASPGVCSAVPDGSDPNNACGEFACVSGNCASTCTCDAAYSVCDNFTENLQPGMWGTPSKACKRYRYCNKGTNACVRKSCNGQNCGFNIQCASPTSCSSGICGASCPAF